MSSYCSIAVERHHAQGNSSKEKHLIGDLPTVLEDYPDQHGWRQTGMELTE